MPQSAHSQRFRPRRERPHKGWSRAGLGALVTLLIAGWMAVAGIGGPTFGKLDEVQSTDRSSFLPASAEATAAAQWQERFSSDDAIPAIVVLENSGGVAPRLAGDLAQEIPQLVPAVGDVLGPFPSQDGQALQLVVPLSSQQPVAELTAELREILTDRQNSGALGVGTKSYVTGPAGFATDLRAAFGGIDGLLLGVAVVAVLIILLIVYRSVLLPFTVLFTAVASLCAAILAVYWMAKADWIRLDGQSQGILSILVIGATTDYCLLLVARFREALGRGEGRVAAVGYAWRSSLAPVAASAGTVVIGLLCLLFSDLPSNRALGPIAASGIGFSFLAALTLLPALLLLIGKAAFWPVLPRHLEGSQEEVSAPVWSAISTWVQRRHRLVWVLTAAVLAIAAGGVTQLKADGVPESSFVLGQTESKQGQEILSRHFPGGAGQPVQIYTSDTTADEVLSVVRDQPGVASAGITSIDSAPMVRPGQAPAVIDGRVQILATLDDLPDSAAAESTVISLRSGVRGLDPDALIGGPTAIAVDQQQAAQEDLRTIIPLILMAILIVLMLLLRALVAPLLLVAATVLSYAAAMGVSALVFNEVFGFPGADPSVPLFGFVFLVALGVDYTIFLVTRAREEALQTDPRMAMSKALVVTGGVITSAGVVLAATFAALAVIPIMFLVQLGFIVAFGVLLDTLVVRTLLIPALGFDLGKYLWWPSKLSRPQRLRRPQPDIPPGQDAKS